MDFVHWEGWIRKVPDGTTYKATEDLNQTSTVILDNTKIEVDNVFNEKDTHKPNLTVVLNKSVGTAIDVSVSPSGNTNSDIKYQDTALKNNYKKEFGKIGTEKGVAISFSNDSVRSGQALKIVTNKIYQDSKETVQETKYVTQIPTTEKFDIYSDKEIATSNVYYEDIEITVSLVDVITYEPKNIDNATISLEYKDTETLLKAGDLIDDDREVVVRITPDNGYYLSGSKNISDGVYENTMTFKKYTSDIDKILGKDHQIKKIYTITLNDEDNYGKVTYKLNGTEVSGSIKVKEGDKLEIGYEITDNNYEVDNSGIFSFTKNKNKKSITITISSDHNGKTINRADYIDVKKK
jgi:hypothetical protein